MSSILIALDVDRIAQADTLVQQLAPLVGGFKVGKQLFVSEGPAAVAPIVGRGLRLFLDLKFHDIPNTVAGAVRAGTRLGAWMMTVHASGGHDMLQAARDAAVDEAAKTGVSRPLIVGVTVLTSLDDARLATVGAAGGVRDQVKRLAALAQEAGIDGVVASPQEIALIRETCGADFAIVTPGIRPASASKDDQARTMTPREAVQAGASWLVIGRPIAGAADPAAAAAAINAEIG
ncbi:orotidine-5'-phosphate decarboxylase [Luteitalea sp.]|uniref:orotidine-5'-phosphate decarboxylase n=1 Tax=Luteitalea sp. TaxID=2004800 RepID=UPI000AE6FFA8|nr:orotidine-5'-phosphate decarboxylase [Luteitalea sp.]